MAVDILAIGQGGRRGGNARSGLVPRRPTPAIAKSSQSAADEAAQGLGFPRFSGQEKLRKETMNEKTNVRSIRKYDQEFKENAVGLIQSSGKAVKAVADELGMPEKTLGAWNRRFKKGVMMGVIHGQHRSVLPMDGEVERLRRQVAYLERQRDILKKALAICSQEMGLNGNSHS